MNSQAIINLARFSLAFGRINRTTYHPDGTTPESDTDHTVMLGLVGCAFAANTKLSLDLGLIAQFALVHDIVEVYANDTCTLGISEKGRQEKEAREAIALEKIYQEFKDDAPWLVEMLIRYESLEEPEARFIKALDKSLPKLTHLLNGCRSILDKGMSAHDLSLFLDEQTKTVKGYAGDFQALMDSREQLCSLLIKEMERLKDAV